jgi:hypothetical protein
LGYRSSLIKVSCDASTDFHVEPCSFFIAYVDRDIAVKRVGENHTPLFAWHQPGDYESIHLIVTSIVHMTILPIINDAIASLPDCSWKIQELWVCREEPNGDCGSYARNVTTILDNSTAAGWIQVARKFCNPTLLYVVYCGQQTDGTAGAQTPMRGGPSYLPQDDILPPPGKSIIDDLREELDNHCRMQLPNRRSLLMTYTGFQNFERKLQKMIIGEQQYLDVI